MSTHQTSRPIPLALTAHRRLLQRPRRARRHERPRGQAHGNEQHPATAVTQKQLALRNDMRMLWEDHIVWTRLAIISLTTGSPDTEATVARLLENQTDIGNAVKPFYGRAAGNELTRQLRLHILIAADVVAAAKAGDQAKLADAQARWARNGDDIAAVLNSVNPRYWKLAAMKAELRTHLRLTTERQWRGSRATGGPTSPPTTRSIATRSTWPTCSRRG